MKMGMYVIRDKLAEESSAPMLCKNDNVAVHSFRQAVARLPYDAFPDYALLRVGEMDTSETSFQMLLVPIEIAVPVIPRDPAVEKNPDEEIF